MPSFSSSLRFVMLTALVGVSACDRFVVTTDHPSPVDTPAVSIAAADQLSAPPDASAASAVDVGLTLVDPELLAGADFVTGDRVADGVATYQLSAALGSDRTVYAGVPGPDGVGLYGSMAAATEVTVGTAASGVATLPAAPAPVSLPATAAPSDASACGAPPPGFAGAAVAGRAVVAHVPRRGDTWSHYRMRTGATYAQLAALNRLAVSDVKNGRHLWAGVAVYLPGAPCTGH